jgi:hypothetical protein
MISVAVFILCLAVVGIVLHYLTQGDSLKYTIEDDARATEIRLEDKLNSLLRQRKENPLICKICTTTHNVVFFEALAWYHCPQCNMHGFGSTTVYDRCTDCASKGL